MSPRDKKLARLSDQRKMTPSVGSDSPPKDDTASPSTPSAVEVRTPTKPTSLLPPDNSSPPNTGESQTVVLGVERLGPSWFKTEEEIEAEAQIMADGVVNFRIGMLRIHEFLRVMGRAHQIADERMGIVVQPAPAPKYCTALTHDGSRHLTLEEYQSLVRRKNNFEMFIDAMRRTASRLLRDGALTECDISTSELEMIIEFIKSRTSMRPSSTEVGRRSSPSAAQKIFDKARSKVDVPTGRYRWRAFQLLKKSDPLMKSFEFRPPDGFRFCVIQPLE